MTDGAMTGGGTADPLLTVSGVHTFYGSIEALRGVDIHIRRGEIVTLIGANGAGKSTLLMTICGQPQAARGAIHFDGGTSRACRRTRSSTAGSRMRPRAAASFRA
jgi:ABC-type branched-subunit amino acid transport system ATPase component